MSLTFRRAKINDLVEVVSLLIQDEFGKDREQLSEKLSKCYIDAFHRINNDVNQYLMVVCKNDRIVGTCHLTLIPSLTFKGATRMQIEAVRINSNFRGKSIGKQMIEFAIEWGMNHGAKIIQLSTNKKRHDAINFYEALGFKATHEGMKLYLEQ